MIFVDSIKDTTQAREAILLADWPHSVPTPMYTTADDPRTEVVPGDWSLIARAYLWPCSRRLVRKSSQLLYFLSAQEPRSAQIVVVGRTGGQSSGYQNRLAFAASVGKRKANVEALIGHSVGEYTETECDHCVRGYGKFWGGVLIVTPGKKV